MLKFVTREPIKIVVKHTMPDAELSASNEYVPAICPECRILQIRVSALETTASAQETTNSALKTTANVTGIVVRAAHIVV